MNKHRKKSHSKSVKILAILPIILTILGVWSYVFDYGKYVEAKAYLVARIPNTTPLSILSPLPKDVKIYTEKDQIVIEQPAPPDFTIHIAWQPWFLAARQVNIQTHNLLSPLGNPNTIMDTMGLVVFAIGIVLTPIEYIHAKHHRKRNHLTVISLYKTMILKLGKLSNFWKKTDSESDP